MIAIGSGVLAGWMFGVPWLECPFPGIVAMKANSAVGFVALGASLWFTRFASPRWQSLIARALALLAALIGILTLAEYGLGRNLGIDQLLFRDTNPLDTLHPGRLSLQTASLFVMLGTALCALSGPRALRSRLPRALTGTSLVIAMFAVIGYAYGISGLTRIPSLTPISLYSAFTFIILCIGISAEDPNGLFEELISSDASAVVAAKRMLPISVVVLPLLGWLQIRGQHAGLYSTDTGVALFVVLSTVVLFVAVLSLTRKLNELDVHRRVGIERDARLAAIVDATSDAVISYDANGMITSWNRAATELYGYTEREVIGRSGALLDSPANRGWQQHRLEAVAAGETCSDVEVRRLHKSGDLVDISVTISRIVQAGVVTGFCGVSRDTTYRTRARAELERRVSERTHDLDTSRAETLQRLALAAEYRDDDTAQHTERVGRAAARLAESLGLDADFVALIAQAAPLHDVGKLAIPDALLLKPGALTPSEFEAMKRHTILGARLLAGSNSTVLRLGEQIALTHHERWDGSGYPGGLVGDAIPVAGRIVAVVDTYDAMTNDRPYRVARTSQEALAEISRCSGTLFDPQVAAAFARLHGQDGNHSGQLASGAARSAITTAAHV